MKRVVVTGGAGFIGSHLAEHLSSLNCHVVILDDLSTGKLSNIESLLKKSNVELIQGSIINFSLLQTIFENTEYIFHQAAITSVPRSIANPQATHNTNASGTLNILIAARDNLVKKVVYASSSSVYGDTPVLPQAEDMAPNPQSPYAVSKLIGEQYCRVFHMVYGLPTVCLRYFNVYGYRQDPESQYAAVIPKFIKLVSEGKPPIIFGDGEQTRDFVFVRDVIEASILAAEGNASGIFNIGYGEGTTINNLAKIIIKLIAKSTNVLYQEARSGEIKHSLADISRAKGIGYCPRYSLEKGLKELINLRYSYIASDGKQGYKK